MGKSKDVPKKGKGKSSTKKREESSDESADDIVISDSDADEEFVVGSTSPVSSDSEGDSVISTSQAGGKKKGKIAAAANNRGARWSEAEWLALLKESVKHRVVMQEWQTKTNKDAKKSALGDIAREYLFLLLLYKKHISKSV